MKTAFLLFFILMLYAVSGRTQSPPPQIKGQGDSSYQLPKPNIQVPNKTATNLGGLTSLIETGNKNILANPSFEHSTESSGWAVGYIGGGGPCFGSQSTSTYVIDGAKAFRCLVNATGGSLVLTQDSTLYQAEFADGVQGLASVRIKTAVSGVVVCTRSAGTTSSTNCINVANDGKWGLYKLPVVLGGTSNGISIVMPLTTINDVMYVDDAFVGAVDLKTDTNNVGPWRSFTPTGSWVSNTTYTGKYRQVGENLEVQYNLATSGTPTSTPLTLNLPSGFTIDTGKILNTTAYHSHFGVGVAADAGNQFHSVAALYNSSGAFSVQRLSSSTGTNPVGTNYGSNVSQVVPFAWGASDTLNITAIVPVTQFAGSSSIYSASCGANCVDTFSAQISNTGVVTGENVDWINGNCTVDGSNNYICYHVTSLATQSMNCQVTRVNGNNRYGVHMLSSSSSTQSVFNVVNPATGSSVNDTAFGVSCSKTGSDFVATRTIIGSFNEVVTAPGITKPKTCYYAFGGAGATLASPTVCSTGTCVEIYDSCGTVSPPTFNSTGYYENITFANGTFANNTPVMCSCNTFTASSGTNYECAIGWVTGDQSISSNSSGAYVTNLLSFSILGTYTNGYSQIKCEGAAP